MLDTQTLNLVMESSESPTHKSSNPTTVSKPANGDNVKNPPDSKVAGSIPAQNHASDPPHRRRSSDLFKVDLSDHQNCNLDASTEQLLRDISSPVCSNVGQQRTANR